MENFTGRAKEYLLLILEYSLQGGSLFLATLAGVMMMAHTSSLLSLRELAAILRAKRVSTATLSHNKLEPLTDVCDSYVLSCMEKSFGDRIAMNGGDKAQDNVN